MSIPNYIQAQPTEPLLFRRWTLERTEPTLAPMDDERRAQLDREIETAVSIEWIRLLIGLVAL